MPLEVILSGEYYAISALKLTKPLVQAVRERYGQNWRAVITRLAVGPGRREALEEVRRSLDLNPEVEYLRRGVLLGSDSLSLQILLDGAEVHAEQLDQKSTPIRPNAIMEGYDNEMVLGVFGLNAGGFLHCVFNQVEGFDGAKLSLVSDDLGRLMNLRGGFELVHAMTYDGMNPVESVCKPARPTTPMKQVFHVRQR